jgi:hypothetical protein
MPGRSCSDAVRNSNWEQRLAVEASGLEGIAIGHLAAVSEGKLA